MNLQGNNINLLKQLPFYKNTMKPRIKEFTKLNCYLSYHFLKNP